MIPILKYYYLYCNNTNENKNSCCMLIFALTKRAAIPQTRHLVLGGSLPPRPKLAAGGLPPAPPWFGRPAKIDTKYIPKASYVSVRTGNGQP